MDLFKPIVAADRLHHNFLATIKPNASGVREILSGWADGFVDRDGKFVTEFQTTYNSSFWELYLFAVLKHLGIKVDFSYGAPDFVAADYPFAVEAAIAGHAQDDVPEWEKTFEGITDMNVEAAQLQSTIRLSNALMGKSDAHKKRYAALPHVAGRAYVVAIANYGRQDFNFLGDVAMQRLLFDPENKKQALKANGSAVPLGLFQSDDYAHISAVVFSSVATFGKARALGKHEGEFVFFATRIRNNAEPIRIVCAKRRVQREPHRRSQALYQSLRNISNRREPFRRPGNLALCYEGGRHLCRVFTPGRRSLHAIGTSDLQ